jgi:hypothetical protein
MYEINPLAMLSQTSVATNMVSNGTSVHFLTSPILPYPLVRGSPRP